MSEHVISTDDQGFDKTVLQSAQPVLVDFWAPWCGPCRVVAPIVDELAGEYAGRLRAVKINVDDSPEVSGKFGVMSIPSLLFFKDGQEVGRVIGAYPKAHIAKEIEKVLAPAGTAAS